jgi:citrate lyase subunit beta/citryl-CoA lyase
MSATVTERRPPLLRRSWLFVGGDDEAAHAAACELGADVVIQELEDSTPPEQRPKARSLAASSYSAWREAGILAAVRINPLETDGLSEPAQVIRLAQEVERLEKEHGLPIGAIELVPNIESARGIMQTYAIATASDRVTGVAGSTEDTAAGCTSSV